MTPRRWILAAVLAAPAAARAQAPEAPISVDVAVTARSGQVPALAAGAFTVTVSGTPREVVAAAPVAADAGAGRTIYLVIDEGSVFKGAEASLRQAASSLADRAAPGDRLGVVLLPSSQPAQAPTDDAAAIERALAGITGRRPNDFANFGMGVGEAFAIAESDSFALTAIADKECQAPPPMTPRSSSPVVPATQNVANPRRDCVQTIARNVETMLSRVRPVGMEAYRGLLDFVGSLRETPGPKTLVLVTAGFAVSADAGMFDELAVRSALSEAAVSAMLVEPVASGTTRRLVPTSIVSERRSLMRRLTELTASALGTAYSLIGAAVEPLDRLMTGSPAIYRLEVRPVAADRQAAGRLVVGVTGAGLTARARPYLIPPKTRPAAPTTPDARLDRALAGEVPTGDVLAIDAAGYLAALPGERAALLMAGEVHPPAASGAADAEPPAVSIAYLLLDAKKQPLVKGPVPPSEPRKGVAGQPAGGSGTIAFTGSVDDLAPGTYTLRVAATDGAGRVGLAEREVVLRGASGGGVTAGDVLIGRIEADDSVSLAPGAVAPGDTVFLQWDAVVPRGTEPAATLRIVDRAGVTVLAIPAQVETAGEKLRASAVLKPRLLPPGDLEVVGEIAIGGKAAAERRRAFVVRGAGATGTPGGGVTLASVVPDVGAIAPRFAREAVLDSPLLGRALTSLEARATSPAARAAIARSRAGDRSMPDAALVRADAVTGAFLSGLADLGSVNLAPDPAARATARADLERAAQRFREALRADADFLPAAVFLGACYALGGRDQEAAGAWQTALIGIDDEPALFTLIVDARLRAGDATGAAELLAEAEGRWPADRSLKPRRVLVDLSQGRVAEALTGLDALERPPADMLFAAMRTLYGAHLAGLAVEDPSRDRARLERYAERYIALGGPDQALVRSWIAAFK